VMRLRNASHFRAENSQLLLLIGASCRAAAWSAQRAGLRVMALDLFGDRDLRQRAEWRSIESYPDSIGWQVRALPAAPVVLVGGMENHPTIVEGLEQERLVAGGGAERQRQWRSLANWQRWAGGDPRFPEIAFPVVVTEADAVSLPSPRAGWLWKSYRSAGGLGVQRWNGEPILDFEQGYLQRRIVGQPLGITFACTPQQSWVLGVTRNWLASQVQGKLGEQVSAPLHAYGGSSGLVRLEPRLRHALSGWIQGIAAELDYRGIIQADFVLSPRGRLYLLEFNPRWTASLELIELVSGLPIMSLYLDPSLAAECCARLPAEEEPGEPGSRVALKAIVYASQSLLVTPSLSEAMMRAEFAARWRQPGDTAIGWADIPMPETRLEAGMPLATILVTGNHGDSDRLWQHAKELLTAWTRWGAGESS
jgi:predicted ATP-grasp superfamily ATP-dependent carboligase